MNADTQVLAALLGEPVSLAGSVGRGRNSRVYRVSCPSGEYAAKFYFQKTADGRDRLQVEYGALGFLWGEGVRCIARPVAADRERQVAVYAFIEGEIVEPRAAVESELDQIVAFAGELKALARRPASAAQGNAAEAFFSAGGVLRNLHERRERLVRLDMPGPGYDALRRFLRERFDPRLAELGTRADAPGELEPRYRTLSPSDFGFHNALRRPDGALAFVDFEYFGWDDPAKLLADLLLHPMMELGDGQRSRLALGLDAAFGSDPGWRARVERLYPLFGLKWCMIMLNEFLPSHIARNRFTGRDAAQIEAVQVRQLATAAAMLDRIEREKDRFPYWSAVTA